MGMISVCRSYFLVVAVVNTVVVVVTLVVEATVESVTMVVELVVCLVVDDRCGLVVLVVLGVLGVVQATLPAWSQVIRVAE